MVIGHLRLGLGGEAATARRTAPLTNTLRSRPATLMVVLERAGGAFPFKRSGRALSCAIFVPFDGADGVVLLAWDSGGLLLVHDERRTDGSPRRTTPASSIS